jgi:hypothetical protein
MIYKKQLVGLILGKGNVTCQQKLNTNTYIPRRIPNVDHSISGYEESLQSSSLSVYDVS